jgi:hypothetical protein
MSSGVKFGKQTLFDGINIRKKDRSNCVEFVLRTKVELSCERMWLERWVDRVRKGLVGKRWLVTRIWVNNGRGVKGYWLKCQMALRYWLRGPKSFKLIVPQWIKDFPRFLLNPKVHYRVHNSPPLVPVLSEVSAIHDKWIPVTTVSSWRRWLTDTVGSCEHTDYAVADFLGCLAGA